MENKSELMGAMHGAIQHLKQAVDRGETLWQDQQEMLEPHRAHQLVELVKEAGALIKRVRIVADGFEGIAKAREAAVSETKA